MRIRLSTFIGMIIIISGASIVGRVVKVISVNNTETRKGEKSFEFDAPEEIVKIDPKLTIGNNSDHLIWFIQISDIHLSIFHDEGRLEGFKKFANETVGIVKPSAVLASGDLTDAKTVDMLGSRQYIKEWMNYNDALKESGVKEKTVWLDIRGNHDNFNVPALSSSNNFYQKYSVQGPLHQRSYMYTIKKGFDTISFIAVDACLLPGPRRPFNFVGILTSKEMEALRHFELESRKHNYTIWFGHYPTSCIVSPSPGIRKLMERGLAYLCGHLHTLGGLARNLYTRQQTGSLELELGDWKDERLFRVGATDHGLFSFVDVPLDQWPIVLITNPKNAMFVMTQNEPLHLTFHSTHIRVLVWSKSKVSKVKVRLQEKGKWHAMSHVDGPLYAAPWTPRKYEQGIHTIEVSAEDVLGRKNVVSQSFALDNSQVNFRFWSRAILMSNISVVFQFLFGVSICLVIIPLCVIRWIHYRVKENKMARPRIHALLLKIWLRKLWILCAVDKLFWPLVLYSAYLPVGPWFIGEVLENHIGVVFAWGTFVYSSFLPGSLTYAYGFLQIILFQCPLVLITAHSADLRFQEFYLNERESFFHFVWRHVSYLILIVMQAMNAYFFWLAYGTMALILGPLRTWAAFLGILMWYNSATLKRKELRIVAKIWASDASRIPDNDFSGEGTSSLVDKTPNPKSARMKKGKPSKIKEKCEITVDSESSTTSL